MAAVLAGISAGPAFAPISSEPDGHLSWVTNGTVETIVRSGNTIYLGGAFTRVGPRTGGGAALDVVTGFADPAFPDVDGIVDTVAPDGSGGWYIGGALSFVGGVPLYDRCPLSGPTGHSTSPSIRSETARSTRSPSPARPSTWAASSR